jgi:hypothetical protein
MIRREWAHRTGCWSSEVRKADPTAVVFVPGLAPDIERDRAGGRRGRTTRWQVWKCNCIDCPARLLVRVRDIEEMVNASEVARG